MKTRFKIVVNAFSIVFFLVPAFALASGEVVATPSTVSVGQNTHITTTQVGGDAVIFYQSDGCSVPACNDRNYLGGNHGDYDDTFSNLFGAVPSVLNGGTGDIILAYVPVYNGGDAEACSTFAGCNGGGYVSYYITIHITSSPPPPSALGLSQVIDNATSSVENVTGFGMNSMALWSWVNIGKPALGMGLGTLYVLRWYIFSLIALAIIIFFAFRYYGFFKH